MISVGEIVISLQLEENGKLSNSMCECLWAETTHVREWTTHMTRRKLVKNIPSLDVNVLAREGGGRGIRGIFIHHLGPL